MAEQALNVRITETSVGRFTFEGTLWGDTIDGGTEDDVIYGYGGNDRLNGSKGNDTIYGGDGADTIEGGEGNDTLDGGTGDDRIDGGSGNDTILAVSGVDNVSGGTGNDIITVKGGDSRFDRVDGGVGNDTINVTGRKVIVGGGSGDDTIRTDLARDTLLIGGEGSDRFVVAGVNFLTGSGRIAEIHGGDASFTLGTFFGNESLNSVTRLADTSVDTLDLSQLTGLPELTVRLDTGSLHDAQGVVYANMTGIENVVGTASRDIVTGNSAANELQGLAGNDTLDGGDGNDRLVGGEGNDQLNGGRHNDSLFGGNGTDTLNGGAGNDVLRGDTYDGPQSTDTLTGGADSDTFVFVNVANAPPVRGSNGAYLPAAPIMDKITDFDTTGADADKIDLSYLLNTRANFNGFAQQAIDQGYVYFVQHGRVGDTDFGTTLMVDLNGGSHTDTANNYAVADLLGVRQGEVSAAHLITYQARGGVIDLTF